MPLYPDSSPPADLPHPCSDDELLALGILRQGLGSEKLSARVSAAKAVLGFYRDLHRRAAVHAKAQAQAHAAAQSAFKFKPAPEQTTSNRSAPVAAHAQAQADTDTDAQADTTQLNALAAAYAQPRPLTAAIKPPAAALLAKCGAAPPPQSPPSNAHAQANRAATDPRHTDRRPSPSPHAQSVAAPVY